MRNFLIFDLGGGTFDVSILEVEGKNYTVLATNGDTHIGGDDFDSELVNYCKARFKATKGINIDELDQKRKNKAMRKLRNECTRAKIILSTAISTDVIVEAIVENTDLSITVTRATFANMIGKHLKKIMPIVEKAINDSGLTKPEIHDIVPVGGSTRIPKVQAALSEFFDNR